MRSLVTPILDLLLGPRRSGAALLVRRDGDRGCFIEDAAPAAALTVGRLALPEAIGGDAPATVATEGLRLGAAWTLICGARPVALASAPVPAQPHLHVVTAHLREGFDLDRLAAAADTIGALLAGGHAPRQTLASSTRVRSLVDSLPAPMLFVDADSLEVFLNEEARALLCIAREQESEATVSAALNRLMRGPASTIPPVDIAPRRREPLVFEVESDTRVLKIESRWIERPGLIGRVWLFFDVTRERRAQAQVYALQAELIHSSRASAMSAMAAALAHELNQPLSALANYSAGMQRMAGNDALDRDRIRSVAELVNQEAMRAGDVVRRMRRLMVASDETRTVFELTQLVRDIGPLIDRTLDGTAVSYRIAEPVHVEADAVQIQQVLLSLVRNAVAAMGAAPARHLSIAVARHGDLAEVRVEDSGTGLSEAAFAGLFEAFAPNAQGRSGIGLSVSRTIVEAHGGRISASNRPEGGAAFSFTLPARDVAGSASSA